MRITTIAGIAAGALLLAGCGGSEEPSDTTSDSPVEPTATTQADGSNEEPAAGGDVDCSRLSKEEIARFAFWTQMAAQVRTADSLSLIVATEVTGEEISETLDDLDQLKGHDPEGLGTPDAGLVLFRTANDTIAAAVAKGDAATDADLAPLTELEPDTGKWIAAQVPIFAALDAACPGLGD